MEKLRQKVNDGNMKWSERKKQKEQIKGTSFFIDVLTSEDDDVDDARGGMMGDEGKRVRG